MLPLYSRFFFLREWVYVKIHCIKNISSSQVLAMRVFVHVQSFEDLTADSEVTTEIETERETVLWESRPSVKEEALCLGAEEETQKEQQHKVEVEEEVCPESRIKEEDVEAGKPIYSRYGTKEALSNTMGVMMVPGLRHSYKVVFLRETPLVLVGVSRTCQSDRELTRELQYIYYQIVRQLNLTQLNHIFQHKQNYDLGRLLTGSEHLTDNLLRLLDRDPGLLVSTVTCLPLASSTSDLVSSRLPRPRTWSFPSSWLGTAWSLWYARRTSWTPICHPKFSTAGFFHTHISYLELASDLCFILVSADREEFFYLSDCKHCFLERLSQCTAYKALKEALKCPSYSVNHWCTPSRLIRFIVLDTRLTYFFPHSVSVSSTSPELPLLYQSVEEQERLMGLYQYLQSHLHHPTRPLRSIYRCGETENMLAWVTSGIELYRCFSPLGTKAVAAVNKLLEWIKREDDCLFVLSSLTY
uniref:Vacuolar fusion protein MON1 homolog n=1 Tax=Oncorhynchus mykiss TaxID=8022 RepID=A0A8C7R4A6_ONCMY